MILDFEKSYDEIADIYGVFPLKENFMLIGNAALAKFGVQAELNDDDIIRIPFAERLLSAQGDADGMCGSDAAGEDPKTRRVLVDACIELSDNPSVSIRDAYCRHAAAPSPDDSDGCREFTDAEYRQSIILIEAFLNAAIDCA